LAIFKRDVNLNLLFLIIILVVLFVGFSTNYQIKMKNMEEEYNEKVQQLEELNHQLMAEKLKVQEYSDLNDLTQKDREALENSCYNLVSKIDDLEDEKRTLQKRLDFSSVTSGVFQKTLCKTTGNVVCHG